MFYGYPFYRSPYVGGFGYPYGYGYPNWGFNGYGGYSSNIVGSAIVGQSVINTGTAAGINQIATPSVIW